MQYQLSRVVAGPLLTAYGRPRVSGLEHIPASGPAILASNHLSIVDSVYLPFVISRPVIFPAKAEYFTAKGPIGRLWASYLRSTNQLVIDRDASRSAQATLDAAVEILKRGDLFGFYPEGTRSPDGRLYRGRTGIGYLALNSGAPVIPVAMFGTRKMMRPGTSFPRPARIAVKIGKPLEFGHLAGDPPGKARRMIADEVMHAIADLSGQEYVHEYASDVKARMGLLALVSPRRRGRRRAGRSRWPGPRCTSSRCWKPATGRHPAVPRRRSPPVSAPTGRAADRAFP